MTNYLKFPTWADSGHVHVVVETPRGTIRFVVTSVERKLIPVARRARLATRPSLTGSSGTLKAIKRFSGYFRAMVPRPVLALSSNFSAGAPTWNAAKKSTSVLPSKIRSTLAWGVGTALIERASPGRIWRDGELRRMLQPGMVQLTRLLCETDSF
jgi:hypothetical protein